MKTDGDLEADKMMHNFYFRVFLLADGDLAQRRSSMFTMSMEQFVLFARDCRALAPSTPVTVGEVSEHLTIVRLLEVSSLLSP